MTDPADSSHEPTSFVDLPIQPTGSGVADLEIAYEQMRLAEGADAIVERNDPNAPAIPTEDGPAIHESAAHPS